MKSLFTFQNFPMAIIIGLVIFSWLILLTVVLFH